MGGYGRKNESLYGETLHDYSAIEKRPYGERQGAYIGMDIQSERTKRYADSVGFSLPHEVVYPFTIPSQDSLVFHFRSISL